MAFMGNLWEGRGAAGRARSGGSGRVSLMETAAAPLGAADWSGIYFRTLLPASCIKGINLPGSSLHLPRSRPTVLAHVIIDSMQQLARYRVVFIARSFSARAARAAAAPPAQPLDRKSVV